MGNIETGGVLMGSYFAAYIFMAVLQGRKELHRTELPTYIISANIRYPLKLYR